MRRFLTLVCLLALALPAGISISGCVRNPAGKYCNGLGYGLLDTQVASLTLQPQIAGISLAYGQTVQVQTPVASTCKGARATVAAGGYSYATTNNQLVDISPTGGICAGTWNRNIGGGIADYTYCNYPSPLPSTGSLPYSIASITVTAESVTSNPVTVYVHAPISSVSLVTTPAAGTSAQSCYSQNQQAQLDAQGCAVIGGQQRLVCAPSSVTSANNACPMPGVTPDIIASGTFTGLLSNGTLTGTNYISGGAISGSEGQTCILSGFNNGSVGATATVTLTGSNVVAGGTPVVVTAGGTGATAPPTQANLSSGTATCSGIAALSQIAGAAGQTCNLQYFNNGSNGASATVTLTGPDAIAAGSPLLILNGGLNATAPPTSATLLNGTASCAGAAAIATTMTQVPRCGSSIGTLSFSVGTGSVASINASTNVITAEQPGTTAITANIAQSSSSAGYFSTCPPESIKVNLANGSTGGVVTQGVSQNLTTTVTDTQDNPITGLALSYQSTNPIDITATNAGSIAAIHPGVATVTATCQPPSCNPAPINELGVSGTGLSLSSNPINIIVPGTTSDYVWFGAPGQSQYFSSIELLSGAPGSTVRLPFVPNSMVMDQTGIDLYFGSPRELMIVATGSNSVTKQDPTVPGVVLAAAPSGAQILINDQLRGLFYLYTVSSGATLTQGGLGVAAAWTPDSNTLYIVDSAAFGGNHTNTLYVYNNNSGWSSYDLASSGGAQNLAVTVPGVGAYLAGPTATVAHAWCPSGTVGNNATIEFYPQTDVFTPAIPPSALGATSDGNHILGGELTGTGAGGSSIDLTDIGVTIPTSICPEKTVGTTETLAPLTTSPTDDGTFNLNLVTNATAVNQVVIGSAPTTASVATANPIAFVTYDTPSNATAAAQLPYYLPLSSAGTRVGYVTFADSGSATPPTAPLAGAFSPDNTLFFVSTAGDNEVHFISIPPTGTTSGPTMPSDSQQFSPNLPACTPVSAGGTDAGCQYPTTPAPNVVVPATVIEVKPRVVT